MNYVVKYTVTIYMRLFVLNGYNFESSCFSWNRRDGLMSDSLAQPKNESYVLFSEHNI